MNRILIFLFTCYVTCPILGAQEQSLFLQLRNGSFILVQTAELHFSWVEFKEETQLPAEQLSWSDIQTLSLTSFQVDKQILKIQKLLGNLEDPSYSVRELAEKELSHPKLTSMHKDLLRKFLESATGFESQTRVKRVLARISGSREDYENCFDELVMKNGSRRYGNAIEIAISGKALNKPILLGRKNIQRISLNAHTKAKSDVQPADIKTYNSINDQFHQPNSTFISFEKNRHGKPIGIGKKVNNMFHHYGLLMETESIGIIMSLKYRFKYCPIETGTFCVCPYDASTGRRLHGNTLLSFCLPDNPSVAAGVHRVGLFIEDAKHSRDFVVEAYNIHGQIIGMVEATDQRCVFAGFQSNEPITQVRIAENDDLPELEREVDRSYALDCITFDKPVVIEPATRRGIKRQPVGAKVNLNAGQAFLTNEVKMFNDKASFTNPFSGDLESLNWGMIQSVAFTDVLGDGIKRSLALKSKKSLFVQLNDGSIVHTEKSNPFSAFDFIGYKFSKADIVGIWHKKARLPSLSDLQSGQTVLVYPSCSIITKDFAMTENRIVWDGSNSRKKTQKVVLFDEEQDDPNDKQTIDPDLTPNVNSVDLSKSDEIPSIWFKAPKTTNFDQHHVRLRDGQYFVLSKDGPFSATIDHKTRSVEISVGDLTKKVNLSWVASISLPKSPTRQ